MPAEMVVKHAGAARSEMGSVARLDTSQDWRRKMKQRVKSSTRIRSNKRKAKLKAKLKAKRRRQGARA